MYLENLPDGRVRAHVQVGKKRKSAIWDTELEAKRWAKATQNRLESTKNEPTTSNFTFGDAVERYKKDVLDRKTDGDIHAEKLKLDAFLRHFGDVPLESILQPEIAAWRDKRLETVSGSTVKRERNILSAVFSIARKEWHWMTINPFEGVRMPKENPPRDQLWNWRQIRQVLRFLGYIQGKPPETVYQQVALAFMITLHTSLRAAECLRVSSKTLNQVTRVITVKTKTVKGKGAQIPITRRALKVCRLANFTISSSSLDADFRKARDGRMIGDFTFHDGRAFCLTMLARKVDILTLSKISMHSDLKTLKKYYRETPQQIASRL